MTNQEQEQKEPRTAEEFNNFIVGVTNEVSTLIRERCEVLSKDSQLLIEMRIINWLFQSYYGMIFKAANEKVIKTEIPE